MFRARVVHLARGMIMDQLIYGIVLLVVFGAIVAWVFARKRKARFEQDAKIPTTNRIDSVSSRGRAECHF